MMRIRIQAPPSLTLTYKIERLLDGLFYDFSTSTFPPSGTAPTAPTASLPQASPGAYAFNLATTAATFTDGEYLVYALETVGAGPLVVALMRCHMTNGDDMPVSVGVSLLQALAGLAAKAS